MSDLPAGFAIRPMSLDELALPIEWAAREGWNPGLHDALPFHAADPEGFLLGTLDGAPVATVSAVRYGADFAFLGFYIVAPEQRGRGFGWAVWQAALAHMRGCTIGLDGVVAQQDNYRRSGFALAHRNMRYEGAVAHAPTVSLRLVALAEVPVAQLLAYDRLCFSATREAFLRAWIARPGTVALGVPQDGRLAGYGVARPCRVGWKIGPLFADTPALAGALLDGLLARLPAGAPFYLDIPGTHPAAAALVQERGMRLVFETARMYLGPAPALDAARIYGITSFELG